MCENIEVTIQKQTTATCLKLDEAENLYFTSWFKKVSLKWNVKRDFVDA